MSTKQLGIIKSSLPHCRFNTAKLRVRISCEKCKAENNKKIKTFDNCASLYGHLVVVHSVAESLEQPTKDDCLIRLQVISDSIVKGILK